MSLWKFLPQHNPWYKMTGLQDETAKYLKFSNELFPESIDSFGRFMSDLLPEVDYEE